MTASRTRLTSLILVEERLREADYFSRELRRQRDLDVVHYYLNAFLSAARSVTFLLQKEMSRVAGFESWWGQQQQSLSQDNAARFFLKLRNFSQKEGRVSLVGVREHGTSRSSWTFRFAGNADKVPAELIHRDVTDCCTEHVAKIATLILRCCEHFPYHVSAHRALTIEGMRVLKLSMHDIFEAAGLPREWSNANDGAPEEDTLRIIRESLDDLDLRFLRRLADGVQKSKSRSSNVPPETFSEELLERMVTHLEGPNRILNVAELAGELFLAEQLRRGKQ